MEVIVRRAEVTLACAGQRLSRELAPIVPSADDSRLRQHSHAAHRLFESEAMKDSRRVGTYLDAGADLAQLGGLFEHLNVDASASKRQRSGEAADAGADDYYSHVRLASDCAAAARRTRSFAAQTPLRMTQGKMTDRKMDKRVTTRVTDERKCTQHHNYVSERSEESRVLQHALRSTISRFIEWIRSSFLARFHPLICFSRAIASADPSNCSKYKSRRTRYFFVNPEPVPCDAHYAPF